MGTAVCVAVAGTSGSIFAYGAPCPMDEIQEHLGHSPRVNELILALSSGDDSVRYAAMRALIWMGPDATEAIPALILEMRDQDGRVRALAASGLGASRSSSRSAVRALIRATADPDQTVSVAAIDAIGAYGPAGRPAVGPLVVAIDRASQAPDDNVVVAVSAATALGKIGPAARSSAESLVKGLSTWRTVPVVQLAIVGALTSIEDAGESTRNALAELANIDSGAIAVSDQAAREAAKVRIAAAAGLWQLTHEPKIVEWLTTALTAGDDIITSAAARALGMIGSGAAAATVALLSVVGSHDAQCAGEAIAAIGKIGFGAKDAIPVLVDELRAPRDAALQIEAARSLGRIGKAAHLALPFLIVAIGSDNKRLRLEAAIAIRRIGGEAPPAVGALGDLLHVHRGLNPWNHFDDSQQAARLRADAADALGEFGSAAEGALPTLKLLLGDEYPTVRRSAYRAITSIRTAPIYRE